MRRSLARHAFLCAAAAVAASIYGCGPDSGVGQDGEYVFVSTAPGVDSTPYPLHDLVQVEQDDDRGLALVYLFSGELGQAGLGLPDLRRVARQFGRFQMAFDTPRGSFARGALTSPTTLDLALADGRQRKLHQLDDDTLRLTGSSRYLASTRSDDYDVRAYFAAVEYSGDLPDFSIAAPTTKLEVPAAPAATELAVTIEDETLTLDYGTPSADYLIVDLIQIIHARAKPNDAIEALVRISIPASTKYQVGTTLIDSAANQGCWSTERPLQLRVTQIARAYTQHPGADSALIQQRARSITIDPKTWSPLVIEHQPAPYCTNYD